MTTTTAGSDSSSEVKAKLKLLIRQREDLEQRISDASGRLHSPGQPGLKESLIDKEVRSPLPGRREIVRVNHTTNVCRSRQ